jgi:hypothetical protein
VLQQSSASLHHDKEQELEQGQSGHDHELRDCLGKRYEHWKCDRGALAVTHWLFTFRHSCCGC